MRLAIVDDNTELGWIYSSVAKECRWQVDQFSDGAELMAILQGQTRAPYHLILLDIVMPNMGADDVVRDLAQLREKPPVALVTGGHCHDIAQVEITARDSGVEIVAALVKPVPLQAVRDLLQRFRQG